MSAETETANAAPAATPPKSCKQLEDGVNHLMQGKRHLLVKDYPSAVASLADACSLLAGKYGNFAPECGEPYLFYGKALLELARAEAGVIEMAPPKSDSDEDEEDEDDDDKDQKEDEEDKESKESEASKSSGEESPKEEDLTKEEDVEKDNKDEAETAKNGEDTAKVAEEKTEKNGEAEEGSSKSNGAGPSKSTDDGEEEDEEGEVNNLQLAWEILEMAKIIYQKQIDAGSNIKDSKTRLSEVLLKLGEVGIESENWPLAIDDLQACLALQKEVLETDDRRLAETFYHLAVAYSNNKEFVESIESYEKACNQLQVRIDALGAKRPNEDMINQGLIDSEIKELKELLVEMKERLNDTQTEKDEPAPKEEQEDIVKKESESKPASNITHLVRKKPKAEEPETAVESKKEAKADVNKTEGESSVEERKRKSEEDVAPAAAAVKKAKVVAES